MFALAFVVRLVFVLAAPVLYSNSVPDHYDVLAHNLVAGRGLTFSSGTGSTVARSPVLPVSIAAVYKLTGSEGMTGVRVASITLDAVTAALVVAFVAGIAPLRRKPFTTREVVNWERPHGDATGEDAGFMTWSATPLLAGAAYALQPFAAYWAAQVMIETLLAFVVMISCVLAAWWLRSAGWLAALLLGLSLGAAGLTKSPALGLPFAFAVLGAAVLARRGVRGRRAVIQAVVVVLLAGAVIAPWTFRNWRLTHMVVPVQTLTWSNFWVDRLYRIGEPWPDIRRPVPGLEASDRLVSVTGQTAREDVASERYLRDRAVSWVADHPDEFALKVVGNLITFWIAVDTWAKNALAIVVLALYVPLAGVGVVWARRRGGGLLLAICLGLIAYFWLVHAPVFAYARYSAAVLPLLCVLVGVGLGAALQRRHSWRFAAAGRSA